MSGALFSSDNLYCTAAKAITDPKRRIAETEHMISL
jgi:hypothetical protein